MKKEALTIEGMQIFVYSFELLDSRMYMIREHDEMLVVDPCIDESLLKDAEGIRKAVVFLTHEHFDHISGVNWLREHFQCCVFAGEVCAQRVHSARDNLSWRFPFLFIHDREKYNYVRKNFSLPYICDVDEIYSNYKKLDWKSHIIELYEVEGHSPGSNLILLDRRLLFAGDNVPGNGKEFQGMDMNRETYRQKTLPILQGLNAGIYVLPGHGEGKTLCSFMSMLLA